MSAGYINLKPDRQSGGRRWIVENARIPANTYRAYCVYKRRWQCRGLSRAAMPWEKCGLENFIFTKPLDTKPLDIEPEDRIRPFDLELREWDEFADAARKNAQ